MSQLPPSLALLEAWDAGAGAHPARRAVGLLAAATGGAPGTLAALPVGRCDARLLELRRALFGSALTALDDCPACGVRLEVDLAVEDLLPAPSDGPAEGEVSEAGWRVRFRLPDSLDLVAIARLDGVDAAARALLGRCLIEAVREDGAAPGGGLPEAVAAAVGARMGELDPLAGAEVPMDCPDCGHTWAGQLDAATFVWAELDAWARRTLHEVHLLAGAYGWSEEQVLALGPRRRARYLELVGA